MFIPLYPSKFYSAQHHCRPLRIPELGMVFVLSKMGNYAHMDIDGDVLHFTGSEGIAQEYGEDGSDAVQNKIYWGTME